MSVEAGSEPGVNGQGADAHRPSTGRLATRDQVQQVRTETPTWLMRLAMLGMSMVSMTGVRAGGFTIADLIFLLVSGFILLIVLNGGGTTLAPRVARRTSPVLLVGLSVFTVGGLLSTFMRSLDPTGSALVIVRLWYITVIWFWALRAVCTNWRDLKRLLTAFAAGAAVNSLYAILQELTGSNEGPPYWGRSTGFTDHFNSLGAAVATTIPLLVVWRSDPDSTPRAKRYCGFGIAVAIGGIGVSGSMTAFASGAAGVFVALGIPWFTAGSRRARRAIVPGIIGAVALFAVLGSGLISLSVTERFTAYREGTSQYTQRSVSSRGELNSIAVDAIASSPVVGVGLDSDSSEILLDGERKRVHSLYFRLLYEAGVFGFVGMLAVFTLFIHQAVAAARYLRRRQLDWIPAALLGAVTMLMLDALFGPPLFERYFWAPFALISVTFGICRSESSERARMQLSDARAR
jgi:hypothetical protein